TAVISLAGGADVFIDFQIGVDLIDATAFGGYQSIVQKSADTLITFAQGVTLRLKNTTAANVTDASFIGLSGPAPVNAPSPGPEAGGGYSPGGPVEGVLPELALPHGLHDGWLL
ncbi:MAG: hypothetical protein Q8J89_00120, partial [Caulobacter sp.]|nr:hypothetical protein [Caulobacter sp.]